MKNTITYGGISAKPGERSTGWYTVPGTDYRLPVTVINGTGAGKSVLITSAIHGCEYASIEAVFEIAETLDPSVINGQIVIINPVNVSAFYERRPYIIPEDGRNLNRLFPGNPDGGLGDRIAFYLTEEFQKRVDFHIDTHGGDIPEQQPSYVYYPGVGDDQEILRVCEEASTFVLHAKYRIKSSAVNHAYTYAALIGTPSLELELGECTSWTKEEVCLYRENLTNLLKYLKVLPGEPQERREPAKVITRGTYLDADMSGRWYAFVGRDDQVKKGQKIGEIKDLFGNVQKEYYADYDGEVLMVCATLAIKKGDPIMAYGC